MATRTIARLALTEPGAYTRTISALALTTPLPPPVATRTISALALTTPTTGIKTRTISSIKVTTPLGYHLFMMWRGALNPTSEQIVLGSVPAKQF